MKDATIQFQTFTISYKKIIILQSEKGKKGLMYHKHSDRVLGDKKLYYIGIQCVICSTLHEPCNYCLYQPSGKLEIDTANYDAAFQVICQ